MENKEFKDWWKAYSYQKQLVYLAKHPLSKLKATSSPQAVKITKEFEEKELPKIIETAKKVFKSSSSYKEKIIKLGKNKINKIAIDIKESFKDKDKLINVASKVLYGLGIISIGAGAIALGVEPMALLNPMLAMLSYPIIFESITNSIKSGVNSTRLVYDFIEGIFQGIREGLQDIDKVKKSLMKSDDPPQIIPSKKLETASGNFRDPSDVSKEFVKVKSQVSELKHAKIVNSEIAIALQLSIFDIENKIDRLRVNNPSMQVSDTMLEIASINDKINSSLIKPTTAFYNLPRHNNINNYKAYLIERQHEFSYVKYRHIAEYSGNNGSVYVSVANDYSSDFVIAGISDIPDQLAHIEQHMTIAEFKSYLRTELKRAGVMK